MNRITILFSSLLLCTTAFAQLKTFTLEDAVLKQYTEFYPERIAQLQWLPEGHQYAMVDDEGDDPTLIISDAETGNVDRRLMLSELNKWLGESNTFGAFPRQRWIDNSSFVVQQASKYYLVNLKSSSAELIYELPESAEEITFNKDFSACAYVVDFNIFYHPKGKEAIQLTADGEEGIIYGKAVHRNEFGIHHGLFWAPDNKQLAFYRMDETMVDQYPLVSTAPVPAEPNLIRYPMAGTNSHHVTIGVFNPAKDDLTYLQTGEPKEQYLTAVSWDPSSAQIYIGVLNRDQNHLKMNRYDASTGAFDKTLFEEKHEKYVEPEHTLWFVPNQPDQFIWQSERSGYDHLYLYATDGKLIRPVTTGEFEVERILGFDQTNKHLLIEGTGITTIERDGMDDTFNATQRFTYRVNYALGGLEMIDDRIGTHTGILSSDGAFIIENFSSIEIPYDTKIYGGNGKEVSTLHEADDPYEGYAIGTAEIVTSISGESGDRLYGRLIKPSDFDPNKKYPVLLYVYGGPHVQLVRNTFRCAAPMWMYWMAEQGYIIATVDSRGSENRGLEFEQATFRQLGTQEVIDQKAFVDQLRDLSYVDHERMAVHGWSYGGFMTINLLLNFPGTFKAGVAGGPVCDWSLYEVMYTERYMDTPQTNAEGFASSSVVNRASALEDDLLIIHGTVDDVVVWQHSQNFVKACVDEGVQLDYFIYPGHPHNVRGKDRVHLMTKVLHYVDDRIGEP